ncbi:MAG: histidine kinase [Flavobacteriaceae bacterium]|nr:histidine kinase [Flavobacteriaceae bacterium]MDZ4147657.1 histidine kinase [Flavobacteriaceae bacterium]
MKRFLNYFTAKNIVSGVTYGFGFYLIVRVFRFAFLNESIALDVSFFNEVWKFAILGVGFILLHQYNLGLIKKSLLSNRPSNPLIFSISIANGFIFVPVVFLMRFIVSQKTTFIFFQDENLLKYLIAFAVFFLGTYTFYTLYRNQLTQKQKIKEQTFLAGSASAKFDALKNQLDPHFLFNSLNVLTGLIDENPEKAQAFTTALSKVYRYVLEQKNKELVSLDEELDFARTYINLLKMRFEDSILAEIPTRSSQPEFKIVPLSLQLLLENAVKHNLLSPQQPLKIRVYEEDGLLVIENSLNIKESIGSKTEFGLENIKQRYALLSSKKMTIENSENQFIIKLPLLTKNVVIMNTKTMSESYIRARKRVDDLKEFYGNLVSYLFVIPFLIFINYRTYWGFQWFWFPMFGWGIGLAIHALKVYMPSYGWEDRKIKEFMEREKRNNSM